MSGRNYSHYQLDSVRILIDERATRERERKRRKGVSWSDVFINKFINDASGTGFSIGREAI